MKDKLFKIFHFPLGEDNATNILRVDNLARVVNKQGLADFYIYREEDELTDSQIRRSIKEADVVLARELPTKIMLMLRKDFPRKRVCYDLDDNPWQVLPSSSHYRTMGIQDIVVKTKNGTRPLWATGITKDFNKYLNMWVLQQTEFMVRQADLVTVPNNRLAKLISEKYEQNVTVIPFYVDFINYPDIIVKDNTKKKDEFRIVWNGGSSHGQDLNSIKDPLGKLMKDEDITFVSIGYWHKPFDKVLPKKQVITRGWVETNTLPYVIKSYEPDVAIIPLSGVEHFNMYKSPMKFLEYAAMKIPMVVKDDLPYNELAQDGENCLIYKTNKEFIGAIRKLKRDPIFRAKLTGNAYRLARKFSLEDRAKDIIKVYKDFKASYKKITR